MKFLPVLKWMINLTLFVALAAGSGALYFWKNSDDLVRHEILKRFHQAAPDLQLIVGGTILHGTRAATLTNIEIRERATDRPLFRAKELYAEIDSNRLLEHQQVIVHKVRLKSADVLLTRQEDGRWNWQQYRFDPPKQRAGLPEVLLEDIRIQLTLKHGHDIPAARLLMTGPHFQAVPASEHGYDFDGAVQLPGAGLLQLNGMCDVRSGEWKLGGQMRDVKADQQLMNLAQATRPELQGQLQRVDSAIESALPHVPASDVRTAEAALSIGNDSRIAPQFLGLLDVDFHVSSNADSVIPLFRLKVGIKDGRLASPSIPFPLSSVTAKLYKDNNTLEFRLENAVCDGARLAGHVLISNAADADPPAAAFRIERFAVSEKIRPLLPLKTLRMFDTFQPKGLVSASGELVKDADGRWKAHNLFAEIHEGTAVHQKFRYPAKQLKGTFRQRAAGSPAVASTDPQHTADDILLDVNITGMVGNRPLRSVGWMKNPGPEAETRFEVEVTDFPLDGDFYNALEEKQRRAVLPLNLTGKANARLVFYRPPGLDRVTRPYFDVSVFDARMKFEKFPYGITNLTGRITFDGPNKLWQFHDLQGRHGDGRLQAVGSFASKSEPGVLELTIRAKNAALDADLYNALSRSQRNLWNLVDPDGFCDLTALIHWTAAPGSPAIVSFPDSEPVRVFNTRIRPRPFPFDMLIKEATLSYDPNDPRNAGVQHCEIHTLTALHGDSPLNAGGWVEAKPDGEWQVHLNRVRAEKLSPDSQLRAALPATWQQTLNRVRETGSLSIEDSEMDFRGDVAGQRSTTARWDLQLKFDDCTFDTGLDVSHIYGTVTADGQWDGFHLQNNGLIRIETAEVLEMPLTNIRGPYSLNDVELVLGARQVFETDSQLAQVDRESRIKAEAYGGELLLDALVDMRDNGRYQFFTELANARLESYAALHIPDQRNLRGVVAAWMSLEGRGNDPADMTGKGQLRISPAALYELPVMVKLLGSLSQLNLNVQNLTAFDYALMNFVVRDRAFWLDPVDLVGESISFRGVGSVGFGGAVDLDFYSRPARTRAMSIPLINQLFTTWTKVEVTGTTDRPQVRSLPMGQLDEGLKQFLQPFNPNPSGPVPVLAIPRVFQRTQPLLPGRRPQNAAGNSPGVR
ncbi:MAG: hypothetical protein R3C59_29465 [Planctomycetaceae bacterium]